MAPPLRDRSRWPWRPSRGPAEVGDLSREPQEAIIACYAAAWSRPGQRSRCGAAESDTSSEVLARAVEHDAIHAASAGELVTLFAEARFSTHVMNEGHRESPGGDGAGGRWVAAGQTVGAGGDDDSWNVKHLAALDVPILQGLCLTSSRSKWAANDD